MATETVYRWHKRGTHKVTDEKRKAYLAAYPLRSFSTVRRVLFEDGVVRAIRLTTHAVNGPEATSLFNEMVADQWERSQRAIAKRQNAKR